MEQGSTDYLPPLTMVTVKWSLLSLVCGLLLLYCSGFNEETGRSQENWLSLFDGKSLEGWIPKIKGSPTGENYQQTFRVVDSFLTVSYEKYDSFDQRFGHLFYRDSFSFYRIRVVYRFIGAQCPGGPGWAKRNSGIMLHCQNPYTMTVTQDFPISIEAQILGGIDPGQQRSTMNLCTPGTDVYIADTLLKRHCLPSNSETYHGDQWVTAEAVVLGDSLIIHLVNDREVLRYEKPHIGGGVVNHHNPALKKDGLFLTGGFISLQSESHPIQFKEVSLLNLCGCMDKSAKNYRAYFVKNDPESCLY